MNVLDERRLSEVYSTWIKNVSNLKNLFPGGRLYNVEFIEFGTWIRDKDKMLDGEIKTASTPLHLGITYIIQSDDRQISDFIYIDLNNDLDKTLYFISRKTSGKYNRILEKHIIALYNRKYQIIENEDYELVRRILTQIVADLSKVKFVYLDEYEYNGQSNYKIEGE